MHDRHLGLPGPYFGFQIMLTKAVGTKAVLYDKVTGTPDIITRRAEVANVFEVRDAVRRACRPVVGSDE